MTSDYLKLNMAEAGRTAAVATIVTEANGRWTGVSDGLAAVFLRGDHPDAQLPPNYPYKGMGIVLDEAIATASIWTTIGELRKWAGDYRPPSLERCDDCGGTGISECYACGHKDDCGDCEGAGKVMKKSPIRAGRIGCVAINRNLLARVLAGPFDDACSVLLNTPPPGDHQDAPTETRPGVPLGIVGDTFVLAVMPLVESSYDEMGEDFVLAGTATKGA